jgi:hypothetical protein
LNPSKGVLIRLIAGSYGDARGPVTEIAADPTYMDVAVHGGDRFVYDIPVGHNAFAYIFNGGGELCGTTIESTRLAVLSGGGKLEVNGGLLGVRFLLVAGKPLNEPIARYGPIVMNTTEEIRQTLRELKDGTFIR